MGPGALRPLGGWGGGLEPWIDGQKLSAVFHRTSPPSGPLSKKQQRHGGIQIDSP